MEDRKHDVDMARRERRRRLNGLQGSGVGLTMDLGGGKGLRYFPCQGPAAVLADLDGDRFVLPRIEVLEDRGRRRDGHLMLTRSSAVNHAHTQLWHG